MSDVDGGSSLRQLLFPLVFGITFVAVGGCGTVNVSNAPASKTAKSSVSTTNADVHQTYSQPPTKHSATVKSRSASTNKASSSSTKALAWPKLTVSKLSQMPHSLGADAVAVNAKGQPFAVGGYTGHASLASVLLLSPSVSVFAQLPQLTHDAAAGFLNGQLTVFGGGQSVSYNTVVGVAQSGPKVIGRLSDPLSDATAVPYTWKGTKGIALIGGYDGKVYRKTSQFISVKNGHLSYTTLFRMPVGLRYTAVAVAGNHIYMVGGKTPHAISHAVYEWQPSDKSPRQLATLSTGLQKAAAFVDGQNLVVIGGLDSSNHVRDTILAIHLSNGKKHIVGHLQTSLADMGYAQIGKVGYIAGGFTSEKPMRASQMVYKVQFS